MADESEHNDSAGFGRAAYMLTIGMLDHFIASGDMSAVQRERIISGALRFIEGPKHRVAENELRKQLGRRKSP